MATAQPSSATLTGQLTRLFPSASTFSPREGNPPHFTAYELNPATGTPVIAGYAFFTTELEPLERGYDGPIRILVGMDLRGILTGIVVASHKEPYGYFSIDLPEFAEQFKGKSIRDRFVVHDDVDAVSRATISVISASRAVRNSSRRIARALLTATEVRH